MKNTQTIPLANKLITPKIKKHSSATQISFKANAAIQTKLGFPNEKVANWQQLAINKIAELVSARRSLQVFLDCCVKCGACTDKCHYFLGTADPKNMPVARQDLFRSVYRRYFTFTGKYLPWLVGAKDLDDAMLDDWYTYFHQCSQCRRCAVFCPYGIDTAEVSMAAREVLNVVGVGQKYCNQILGKSLVIGNNIGLPEAALQDTLSEIEDEVMENTGIAIKYPLDVKGAQILLIVPSADFFAEPHIDSLIGYGKVFHQDGASWTMSSEASEAANFGMFIGNYDIMHQGAMRIRKAAIDLGVTRIIVGECGHAWRVAYSFWNSLTGIGAGANKNDEFALKIQNQLDKNYPQPQHIIEYTYALIQQGKLKFNKANNDKHIVTFHDSCNVARATNMGGIKNGQFILPREVIKAVCNNYVEMHKSTTMSKTFCCGAGAGILTDDLITLRTQGAIPRMQAFQQVKQSDNVNTIAAICAICKSQFSQILPKFDFDSTAVVGIHQLVSQAIITTKPLKK